MNNYNDRMNLVIKYIDENLSAKLSLDDLADVSNFSKYHFSRLFTSYVGMTPSAYITEHFA